MEDTVRRSSLRGLESPKDKNETEARYRNMFEKYPEPMNDASYQTWEAQRITIRIFKNKYLHLEYTRIWKKWKRKENLRSNQRIKVGAVGPTTDSSTSNNGNRKTEKLYFQYAAEVTWMVSQHVKRHSAWSVIREM